MRVLEDAVVAVYEESNFLIDGNLDPHKSYSWEEEFLLREIPAK